MEINDSVVWDRRSDGGFPDLKIVKNRVKDVLDPSVDLGHSEITCSNATTTDDSTTDTASASSKFETHLFVENDGSDAEELDEDEMLQMRRMWGVM